MKKKLYTSHNEYEDIVRSMEFDIIDEIPDIGDWWDSTCEVINVTKIQLDDIENEKSFPEKYEAYRVEYINRGCDDEREDPFVDYVAIVKKGKYEKNDYIDEDGYVYIGGVIEALQDKYLDKQFDAKDLNKECDVDNYMSNLIQNGIDVWLDTVHTNPYDNISLFKIYTDEMKEQNECIIVEVENNEDVCIITDIASASWSAYTCCD